MKAGQNNRFHWCPWLAGVLTLLVVLSACAFWLFGGLGQRSAVRAEPLPCIQAPLKAACADHDPIDEHCTADAQQVYSTAILYHGRRIGSVDILSSPACQTKWIQTEGLTNASVRLMITHMETIAVDQYERLQYCSIWVRPGPLSCSEESDGSVSAHSPMILASTRLGPASGLYLWFVDGTDTSIYIDFPNVILPGPDGGLMIEKIAKKQCNLHHALVTHP